MSYKKYFGLFLGLAAFSTAFAGINANNGLYLGADLIGAGFETPQGAAFSASWIPVSFTVRPFIGYRFTDFVAVEGGYSDIMNSSHNVNGDLGPDHYRLYSIDLAAKLIFPFKNGVSLFGKIGGAYTHQNVYNQYFVGDAPLIDSNTNKVLPLLGAGISYNFTPKFAGEFTLTNLFKSGSIGDIAMVGLGLSYTFGS